MALFPGALPAAGSASASATLAASGHTSLHNTEADEARAIATKVGTGASTPASGLLLRGNGAGTSAWAQVGLTTDVSGVLPQANGGTGRTDATGSGAPVYQTSPTIATPTVSGGNFSSPTITTPTIASFINALHDHTNAAGGGQLGFSALLSTIFSGQLVADTNPGTGLGTRNFINLGGLKILWGTTTAQSLVNNANLSLGITFGTAFTTAPSLVAMPYNPPDNRVSAVTTSTSTTAGVILLQSNNLATNNIAAMWFAIGV